MSKWGKGRGGRPWRRLVEAVKRRDAYTCQKCGRITAQGDCDHVVPESEGGKTVMANLQWLCRVPCHLAKSQAEAARAQGIMPKTPIGEDGWPAG